MNTIKLLSSAVYSTAMRDYELNDPELNNLLQTIRKAPENWQSSGKIIVSTDLVPAQRTIKVLTDRLNALYRTQQSDDLGEYSQIEEDIQKIIKYCSSNPTASTGGVIINFDDHGYTVHLGIDGTNIEIICVIKSGSNL